MDTQPRRFTFNAPVIIICAFLSGMVLLLDTVSGGTLGEFMFMTYRSSWTDPMTYFRLVFSFLGHSSMTHYLNNMTLFLLLGPVLEKKYGERLIVIVILTASVFSGLVNALFFESAIRGTGAVDFAFVILLAMTLCKKREIPVSLILVICVYAASEAYSIAALGEAGSALSHISGGICGFLFGLLMMDRN